LYEDLAGPDHSYPGTSRRIEANHLLDKLEALTGRQYR